MDGRHLLIYNHLGSEKIGWGRRGLLNLAISDDFRSDTQFMSATERLHQLAARSCFAEEFPTTDGLEVLAVDIDFGVSIWVDFQLWFFADRCDKLGHSAAPGRFTVSAADNDSDQFVASFGCGLRGPDAGFWYPREDAYYGRLDQPPNEPDQWAYWKTKTYGDSSLASWIANRPRGGS